MAHRKTASKNHVKAAFIIVFLLVATIASVALSGINLSRTNKAAEVNPNDDSCVTCSKKVFVTSTTYDGNLGGLSGADLRCQKRAGIANLGGTWKAWLSDSTTSAASRMTHFNGPYRLLNGTKIALNWNDLTDGTLLHAIDLTELLTTPSQLYAWTHTLENGNIDTVRPIAHCSNWTTNNNFYNGGIGYIRSNNVWSAMAYNQCTDGFHLYCFEQ